MFESSSIHHSWDTPQHFLKTHFCLESGFPSFLELQKSLLESFQGCWTQWHRFESSSIHHFWDTPQHFLKTHFCVESSLLTFLVFYFHHFHLQLSSFCNWPSSWLHPLHNIPSWGTFLVLWSSGNFCNISQNMHSKAPVASQHEKSNKVDWTCKDDWPPWRTSTYKRPFIQEGNYLVFNCHHFATDCLHECVHFTRYHL